MCPNLSILTFFCTNWHLPLLTADGTHATGHQRRYTVGLQTLLEAGTKTDQNLYADMNKTIILDPKNISQSLSHNHDVF